MTTQSDDSSRMKSSKDSSAAQAPDGAHNAPRATKGKKGARSHTAAAAQAAATAHSATSQTAQTPVGAPITQELPAAEWPSAGQADAREDEVDEVDEGATREVPAISSGSRATPAAEAWLSAEPAATSATSAGSDDPDATVVRSQPAAVGSSLDQPITEPAPPRTRYNTLAGAFNRSRASASDPAAPTSHAQMPSEPLPPPAWTPPPPPMAQSAPPSEADAYEDILDEVGDEDEWSLADQPTVQWTPQQIQQMQQLKPDFSPTGEQPSWPPRPGIADVAPESDASHHDWRVGLPPRPQPPFPLNGSPRTGAIGPRLAAPDGRVAPPPPSASVAGAQPDPRMARFQELRGQRVAHGQGERADGEPSPVAASMRQWWNDVVPVVQKGLHIQREARASGMHPIPAYEVTAVSRLGDAFGRLAASARELSERAQQAAAPTIKRLHDQVEQAAQGIISRFEGDPVRQQAPLLGPGRIAIFFRQGVSVGQAQRLLAASAARPMRLIPRKHGFLARVQQGKEAEVCERLRQHPYVSDVVYLEFNEYGEPVGGRR
jgi:hypothetical protein